MRPIAIIMPLLLLSIFPSQTASQTNVPVDGTARVREDAYRTAPLYNPNASEETAAKNDPTTGLRLGASRNQKNAQQKQPTRRGGFSSIATIIGSLALVIGIFLVVAFLIHRASPKAGGVLPGEVVEVLGRAPLAERQNVHLLRCGNKLLLVSVTPNGAETLTEITASEEVQRLSALCSRDKAGSSTADFRRVFQQLSWGNADE